MLKMINFFLIIALLCVNPMTYASNCSAFIKTLTIPHVGSTFDDMEIKNLITNLGHPNSKRYVQTEYFYQWPTFTTWFTSKGVRFTVGSYPGSLYVKDFDIQYILRQLGAPKIKKVDHQVEYIWNCKPKGAITAIAFDDGSLKNIEGADCDKTSCLPFSKIYNMKSPLQIFFEQQMMKLVSG